MNSPYYLKVKNKEGGTILTLNAKDIEDIYRQAHNFVNEIPNSIIMTNNNNKIFILLSPDINTITSKKKPSIDVIGNNNYRINKYRFRNSYRNNAHNAYSQNNAHNAYNAFNAFNQNNAYNAYYKYNPYLYQANNICKNIIQRNINIE